MKDFKPCPACGGKTNYFGEALACSVTCVDCGLNMFTILGSDKRTPKCDTYKEFVDAWNARPTEDKLNAEINELKAALQLDRIEAFTATNPANWQRNDTPDERIKHYETVLDEIANRRSDIHILGETFDAGIKMGTTMAIKAIEEIGYKDDK